MGQVHVGVFNTLQAVDRWMKTISNNIEGSTVVGFKGQQTEFGEVLSSTIRGGARPTDGYGSVNPIMTSESGIHVKAIRTDFSAGTISQDGDPTHLAISGDAMFILSRVPVPRSMEDLTFTRDGSFHFEQLPGPVAGTGTYRMVNNDGLFVMGYNTTVDDASGRRFGTPPEESHGTDLNAFSTVAFDAGNPAGLPVQLQNIQLDMVRNPDAANHVSFDSQGMLRINGDAPRDLANNLANMHVGLAKFANNEGLVRQGNGSYFDYDIVAGEIFAGTAANSDPGRVVGKTNVISSGALEMANTSINTVMPELTLAQKSFSAASKIITVGNTMIDDVTGLVR